MAESFPLLHKIQEPNDVKSLTDSELVDLCEELRRFTIETISKTGGHLAPTLGVIELTVALFRVFDSPRDRIIWDVGHQAYAHKILTGRRDQLKTIRQYGGLSGFLKRDESEHDQFGAGHASTSISAGVGFAKARDLKGEDHQVISIIGDGSLTGGLAYEGLNNLGSLRTRMLIILNDNEMSISPNVGAIAKYLNKIVTNPLYNQVREEVWKWTGRLPVGKSMVRTGVRKLEESLKNLIVPGVLFDEMGIRYFGPINGHDLPHLIDTLENIKDIQTPVLLHILTQKGHGYSVAEEDPVKYHGVGPAPKTSDPDHGSEAPPYLRVMGTHLQKMAERDARVVAVTAAMREGTGLYDFSQHYPNRFFDVGIAEGHAVTFAAGLAAQGMRPVVAIYSTFLQRAFDHIVHDVAIQHLPVIFTLDRAGLVGQDGPTHHGAFDLSYLGTIPGVVIAAPADGNELVDLLEAALKYEKGPFFIRYPKASAEKWDPEREAKSIRIGSWKTLSRGSDLAIIALGAMNSIAAGAQSVLKKRGISTSHINARFMAPMDEKTLRRVIEGHQAVLILEENVYAGGFSQKILAWAKTWDIRIPMAALTLPNRFITHGSRGELLQEVGLTIEHVVEQGETLMKNSKLEDA